MFTNVCDALMNMMMISWLIDDVCVESMCFYMLNDIWILYDDYYTCGLYGTKKLGFESAIIVKMHIFVFCSVVTDVTLGDGPPFIALRKKTILDKLTRVM